MIIGLRQEYRKYQLDKLGLVEPPIPPEYPPSTVMEDEAVSDKHALFVLFASTHSHSIKQTKILEDIQRTMATIGGAEPPPKDE